MNGSDILAKAKLHLGEEYILGARAPLANPDWRGPWDCAEYASWLAYQTYGIVYGCGTTGLSGADPYSGYWADDADRRGVRIPAEQAAITPGAFLVRRAVASLIGHVAIAVGDGTVYEAAGRNLGVRIGPIAGRRWDLGVLLPGVDYGSATVPAPAPISATVPPPPSPPSPGATPMAAPFILRRQQSPTFDDHVVELQMALRQLGYDPGKIDGLFGEGTETAVYAFQIAKGFLPDGEVGPTTGAALGLRFWPAAPAGAGAGAGAPAGASAPANPAPLLLQSDAFGAIVNKSTAFVDIADEYAELFRRCIVQDRHGEIVELARRIADNRSRYESLVASLQDLPGHGIPWYFVALIHAMEASGDIGRFKTHLHNGDPLTRPTVRVPENRPRPDGQNFTWEESARDALVMKGFGNEANWSLARMLYRLEKYNGMGPRRLGHASAYLWSYSNHYIKGKYIRDHVWDDETVSKQPGAAAILKQLESDGTVTIP